MSREDIGPDDATWRIINERNSLREQLNVAKAELDHWNEEVGRLKLEFSNLHKTYLERCKRVAVLEEALRPPQGWVSMSGIEAALEHGFTEQQYRAAKAIEYRIFGPYEWKNQEDRAATMMVAICQALKDEADAIKAKEAMDG